MTALTHPDLVSVEEYLAGEEIAEVKHEYLGGMVHAMAGASNAHNTVALNFLVAFHGSLNGKPCRPFNSDTKIRINFPDQIRFYYPDAMVVCQANPVSDHFQDLPVVVLEVLSESTRRTDLGEKFEAYLRLPSLKVLIFAEQDRPMVFVHRRQAIGGFLRETYSGLEPVIGLPEIESSISMGQFYDGLELNASPSTPS